MNGVIDKAPAGAVQMSNFYAGPVIVNPVNNGKSG